MTDSPILMWFRRDLRLTDNVALFKAAETGRPIVPVFLYDQTVEAMGAAPKWRMGLAVAAFTERLEALGSRLILRRGRAETVLPALAAEIGAGGVVCTALHDPEAVARDRAVAAALDERGLGWKPYPGHVLFAPDSVATKDGSFYKVYTPYWRARRDRNVPQPVAAPKALTAPDAWPDSDRLEDWRMGAAMRRGAEVVANHVVVGEEAAQDRLDVFLRDRVVDYTENRNLVGLTGTSRLSENLTHGEISVRTCWHAGQRAMAEGQAGAETFLKELVWRDFAHHLAWHTPHLTTGNWRAGWDAFPWNTDESTAEVMAWRQGRTGIEFVDAAMRELYVTGYMHNRARMIVASYLTKHLMTHWKIGLDWFADCLTDWDPAANAMGWQWVAGSGPDAAPYFRVFNPATQLEKFDGEGVYRDRWIAEGAAAPSKTALSYFDAVPKSWGLSAGDPYPEPVITLSEGRNRALAAYEARDF